MHILSELVSTHTDENSEFLKSLLYLYACLTCKYFPRV